MAHPHCDLLLQVHGSIALSAIGAFYLYSDRTEGFISSLNGTGTVLTELRRQVAGALSDKLSPLFRDPSDPSLILGPDGEQLERGSYFERPVNPIGSDAFREAVRAFVDSDVKSLADYRSLSLARSGWCFWSSLLSRCLLALFVWQVAVLGTVLLDKNAVFSLTDWLIHVSSAVTGMLVAVAITAAFVRLHHYHHITQMRLKHGEL